MTYLSGAVQEALYHTALVERKHLLVGTMTANEHTGKLLKKYGSFEAIHHTMCGNSPLEQTLPNLERIIQPIPLSTTGTYIPPSEAKDLLSGRILSYKEARDYYPEAIKNGARSPYFHNGVARLGDSFKEVVEILARRLQADVQKAMRGKRPVVVGAPNSNPEFCYPTDMNHQVATWINKQLRLAQPGRLVTRIQPQIPAHAGGSRNGQLQLQTMGTHKELLEALQEYDQIIIIDDVHTSGSTLHAAGTLLHETNSRAAILGISIAQTRKNTKP